MKIIRLSCDDPRFGHKVAELEKTSSYPLGKDAFRLDHGADYFSFFRRLGDVRYYAVENEGAVVAVAAGVLRQVPWRTGEAPRKTWYLCDLKVHPAFRGKRLPWRIFRKALLAGYLKCGHGYAISMNPGDGSPNRVVTLLERFRWAPLLPVATLGIYSWDFSTVQRYRALLEKLRGQARFFSLGGKKDLILASTGKPLALLHAQFGSGAEDATEPRQDFTHMFCCPSGDPMALALENEGLRPTATASVLAHRMASCDWRFVGTGDI